MHLSLSQSLQVQLATLFVASVLAAPLIAGLLAIWRGPFRPIQNLLWYLAKVLVRLLWRAQLPAEIPMPAGGGGAVVISNHRSSIDPFFLQTISRRVTHWMVAKEYCVHFAFRWFLKAVEVIPVNRGGVDTAAVKSAIRYVKNGGIVGMFPEGRINMTDEFMLPCRPGAILVAVKANAPIIPCYIQGSPYCKTPWSPFFLPARVKVTFGDPIQLPDEETKASDQQRASRLMIHAIRAIAELAGRPDFEPKLAGRRWKPTREELDADMARS